ncbi:outer membrane protein assembly factor BamB [Cellvibrio zantedeschiae]|uniref:Outer membrane protein assembly factor BamB n=1 Tax=Cellvibrio zantedeschiae TaxID=1237077 RepID=A0ABQ3AXB9_9GAMM|nr:outer membrane protein assembly factor BamB [Cellvibrio zantedeschiae]GGY67008.1 outer membrane protein assembly factor BamB [Cellvibrio zantedeschiae]
MRHLKWGLLLCALLMSSCSWFSKKTGQEPMELESFKETANLKEVWSTGVGDGQGIGLTQLTPAIDADKIYTVDHEGIVTALNRQNGKKLWSKNVSKGLTGISGQVVHFFKEKDLNNDVTGGISYADGLLYIGNYAGEVIALSATNGKEVWRKQVKGEISSVPQSNGQVVAVQTMNGKLFVLDAKSGADMWFFENPPPLLTLRGSAAPVVMDTAIYAGFANGRLMAFNPSNGLILWEQRMALPKGRSELDRMVDIHASPLLKDGILYVGTYQGRIAAVARGTGGNVWGIDGSTSEILAASDDKLFVSLSDGKVVAYSLTSGEQVWQNEKLLRRRLSGPQVFGDYVAVVDFEGYMHVLKQSTGELAARDRVDRNGARAPMLTDGKTLYVYGNGGSLMAFTANAKK